MQLIRHPRRKPADSPSAVAIGNFDGLHRGHGAILARTKALAAAHGLTPSVLTFEPHPRRFFAPSAPDFRLEPLHRKLRRLCDAGVERVAIPNFNADFASLSPEAFLDEVMGRQLKAKAIVTGENFAFGKGRAGTSDMLRAWGASHGVHIETMPPVVLEDGTVCSSTAVRQAIAEGDMPRAALLLGRAYEITGRVVHGDHRGRELGFPTANIALTPRVKLPAYGVYAVRVTCRGNTSYGGKTYDGVANLGLRPTMGETPKPRLEAHLFDFDGTLYGLRLTVAFHARIRAEKRFDSLQALTQQIAEDCHAAQTILSTGA